MMTDADLIMTAAPLMTLPEEDSMQTSLTRLTADDGTRLVVHIWLPEWLIDGSLLVADAPAAPPGAAPR